MSDESQLTDQNARSLLVKRRRYLRLPNTAHGALSAGLTKLHGMTTSRGQGLPPATFPDEVANYHARHKALGAKGPRPRLRTNITTLLAEEQAIKVDAALNLAELGQHADPLVKPILLYHACVHLSTVYSRTFFRWDMDSRGHGLTWHRDPDDQNVANTEIFISNSGQFPRVVVACFLFTGQPNCFSPLVTYAAHPADQSGEFHDSFGKTELGAPVTSITLGELAAFDFTAKLRALGQRHGLPECHGLASTAFLTDILTMFVASALARYDVVGWKRIWDAKDYSFRVHFEETYDRFLNYGIDVLLAAIDDPLKDFDRRLIPSRPSPYSYEDSSRFKATPSYEN